MMKIAISSSGKDLDSQIDPGLGDVSTLFLLILRQWNLRLPRMRG
jgi:hypothetical protein